VSREEGGIPGGGVERGEEGGRRKKGD